MLDKDLKKESFFDTVGRHYLYFTAGLSIFTTIADLIKELIRKQLLCHNS